jgi:hypothetical protein
VVDPDDGVRHDVILPAAIQFWPNDRVWLRQVAAGSLVMLGQTRLPIIIRVERFLRDSARSVSYCFA